jgi:Tol biopolymer transport system component
MRFVGAVVVAASVIGALLLVVASAFVTSWIGSAHASRGAGKIVFAGEENGYELNILAVSADGTGLRRLAVNGGDPTVSPDGTQIAFSRNTNDAQYIVAMSADGTRQRRVGDANGESPVWSPDGAHIAYAGEALLDSSIYVVNANGATTRRVAADAESFGFAWSPNGKQIAYGTKIGIALIRVDGTGKQVLPTDSGEDPWRPAWSPDGTRIAFLNGGALYVTNVDGSGETPLTDASYDTTPSWSPNGRQILFARDNENDNNEIYVINANGTGERRLTRSMWGENFDAPVWSPDGTQIAFLRGRLSGCCGANDVWIMNIDGSGKHAVTTPLAQDGLGDALPVWTLGRVRGSGGGGGPRMVTLAPKRRLSALAPVSSPLAADGTRAAMALGCSLDAWDPGTGRLDRAATSCIEDSTVEPAVAGKVTAWILDEAEGNDLDQSTLFVKQAGAQPTEEAVAEHLQGEFLANLFGDGSLLVFNTWRGTWSDRTEEQLWRLEGSQKTLVRSGDDAEVVAVDDVGIVTLRADGRLTLLSADGKTLRTLSLGPGIQDVQLDGAELVVLRRARLEIYDLRSGRLARRRPTQLGISGNVRLEDVDQGIAVYVAGLAVHVLRLSDGRDVTLRLKDEGSEAHAQLEPAGLFYAYNQAWTTKPGRLGFVPLRAIERLFRQTR